MHFTTSSFFLFIQSYKWSYKWSLVRNGSQISALRCLEIVANKKSAYLEKKATHKKNFHLER